MTQQQMHHQQMPQQQMPQQQMPQQRQQTHQLANQQTSHHGQQLPLQHSPGLSGMNNVSKNIDLGMGQDFGADDIDAAIRAVRNKSQLNH